MDWARYYVSNYLSNYLSIYLYLISLLTNITLSIYLSINLGFSRDSMNSASTGHAEAFERSPISTSSAVNTANSIQKRNVSGGGTSGGGISGGGTSGGGTNDAPYNIDKTDTPYNNDKTDEEKSSNNASLGVCLSNYLISIYSFILRCTSIQLSIYHYLSILSYVYIYL
jgi:hypothetical protein